MALTVDPRCHPGLIPYRSCQFPRDGFVVYFLLGLDNKNEDVDDVIFWGDGFCRQAVAAFSLPTGTAFAFDSGSGHLRQSTAPYLFSPFFFGPFVVSFVVAVLFSLLFSFRYHQGQCAYGCYDWTAARIWYVAVVILEAISAPPAVSPRSTVALFWCDRRRC